MASRRRMRLGQSPVLRLCLALLVAGPAFAGCGQKGFTFEVPLWKAGYGWQYDQETVEKSTVTGQAPGSMESLANDAKSTNGTYRLEVFNSTASSVEGIPVYAVAAEEKVLPDENQSVTADDKWDAQVFSADLNYVEPTYVDWRNQEIQLSGSDNATAPSGSASKAPPAAASGADGATAQPQNEFRRLDWPLSQNHQWRHEETIPQLDTDGVFEGKAVRQYVTHVPAGNFSAVRIEGTLTASDLSDIEDGVKESLQSQGGKVDSLSMDFSSHFNYAYSDLVLNIVYFQQIDRVVLKARGTDGEHNHFDFTFAQEKTVTRKLNKYQLTEGLEKPLTFALDVKRGAYSPKPITPASALAVEILVDKPDLNAAGDEAVDLGVRIYNSTAGEKKVRTPESSYPAVVGAGEFHPTYDHSYLDIQWSLSDLDDKGHAVQFLNQTTDMLHLTGKDFTRPGLKQVSATLKLKDGANGPGQQIFTDNVLFEVYTRTNVTAARNATANSITAKFTVFPTAARVSISATEPGVPDQGQCVFVVGQDCIAVTDAQNRNVQDERTEHMKFESTRLGQYIKGDWTVRNGPTGAQSTVFEIIVRYRPGV